MEYIYAVTFEADDADKTSSKNPRTLRYAKPFVRKFRVLLMKKQRFLELTNGISTNGISTPRSAQRVNSALTKLKWQGCSSTSTCCVCDIETWKSAECIPSGQGCYGADRIRDLLALRKLLEDERKRGSEKSLCRLCHQPCYLNSHLK